MGHDRSSGWAAISRRQWLALWLVGIVAASVNAVGTFAADPDDKLPPLEGRLFTNTRNTGLNQQAGHPFGVGQLDLRTGTWTTLPIDHVQGNTPCVSHDGRFVAFYGRLQPAAGRGHFFIYDVDADAAIETELTGGALTTAWSSDGQSLLIQRLGIGNRGWQTWRVSPDGKTQEQLSLPSTIVHDWSPDGQRLLIAHWPDNDGRPVTPNSIPAIDLVKLDGAERKRLVDGYLLPEDQRHDIRAKFMPDGRRVLYPQIDPKTGTISVWTVGIDGEDRKCVLASDEKHRVDTFCVSPDGKKLAVVLASGDRNNPASLSWELNILDLETKERRPIPLALLQFEVFAWRRAAP
jgi:Tol biopolymer transport system component